MKIPHILFLVLLCAAIAAAASGAPEWEPRVEGQFTNVYLIPIDREIDETLAASVERRIGVAKAAGADLVIFEVDSPGGLVSASMDIGDLVYELDIPNVMLIMKGAYSGAALVALAGKEILMGEGGILGDCQPIALGPEGITVIGEKIQSPLRAIFRKFADRNGYHTALAEAMITEQLAVDQVTFNDGTVLYLLDGQAEDEASLHGGVRSKKRVVREGELLTLHGGEAAEFGFTGPLLKSREEAFEGRLGVAESDVVRLDETWAETTSRFLLSIKVLLFFAGIMALYMELKVPGFGVPGVIAVLAFGLFFSASAVAGISGEIELALFVLGVLALVLELLVIPGFGIAGIAGIGLILVSLYMASVKYAFPVQGREWDVSIPGGFALEFGVAVALSIGAAALIARFLPSTSLGRRLILAPAGPPGSLGLSGSGSVASQVAAPITGRTGVALTDLRPSGRIRVDGEPFDAVSQGDWIGRGRQIVVLEVAANRVVVKEARDG